jgi:hypothetical protein
MAEMKEKYVVDEYGKKTAVLIPLHQYRKLLEDLHDLAIVAERRDEEIMSFGKLQRRLKDDGLL